MFKCDYNIYLGNEVENIHVDFIADDNFFLIFEFVDGLKKKEIKDFLNDIKNGVRENNIQSLEDLEKLIDDFLKDLPEDSLYALSTALYRDDVVYVVTRGTGEVFIARDKNVQKLIDRTNKASGYIKENDVIVLTSPTFSTKANEEKLSKVIIGNTTQAVVESLTPELKSGDDTGLIALFIQSIKVVEQEVIEETSEEFKKVEDSDEVEIEKAVEVSGAFSEKKTLLDRAKSLISDMRNGTPAGKKATLIIVIILLVIFVWSVILGNERRQKNEFINTINVQELIIDEKLAEAEDLSVLNVQKSLSLFEEVQNMYNKLQAEAEEKKLENLKELRDLGEKIKQKEQDVKRTEQVEFEEFYDLNLIEKGAEAVSMYVENDNMALLDKKNGKVYILSIEKKSVDTIKHNDINKGSHVALHRNEAFVYGDSIGVITFNNEKKKKVALSADKDLSAIKDFWMFNGNIYLLDAGNDEVYKYLVAQGGYSRKTSYFASGQSASLSGATAMAIDGSIYIAVTDRIMKYTAGAREEFSAIVPEEGVTFEDIYISESLNKLYLLSKKGGTIFIFSKDGTFEKQISASVIAKANDFVVVEGNKILVLVKDKIYSAGSTTPDTEE